ncbi:MAG TPA: pyridoxal phosphate-dependent aminotransferase [Vicinamibacteria bacterium]|nr:pyridoxal phosphate-dependent aminotransferase [Vicinamibacteria bacterium]
MAQAWGALPLARRARRLGVSPTVAMAARARALRETGVRVLDFTVGEPDQPTPPHVVEAGRSAIAAGRTRYAPAAGLPQLRSAVAHRYREDFGLRIAPEEVVVTVGGKQALALFYQAVLDRGSEVVVPVPAWPTFAEAARVAGGTPVLVRLSERSGFRISARAVAQAVSRRTRAVVINSPSNPTGAVVDPSELLRIAALARRHGFWLVYDDTYAHLVFDGQPPPALQAVREAAAGALVVVGTVSKSYSMTGWRVGWVIGPAALVEAATALNSHSVQGPATFSQLAAAEALTASQEPLRAMAAEYRRRRDFIHSRVAALPGVRCTRPGGGFYVFPDVTRALTREVPDTLTLATRLLDETSVAVVPGEGFHAPGFFRLSFAAAPVDLEEGARRLAAFFDRHAPARGRA